MQINKEHLLSVIEDWSFWAQDPPISVTRDALSKLSVAQTDLVYVLQGVRRSGKSTCLAQVMSHFSLDRTACFYINFEDPRLSDCLDFLLLESVVDVIHAEFPQNKRFYFFFDEIQSVQGWEKWFHRKLARTSNDIFIITGSNAALLHGDLSTALTGRHLTTELFPFSYSEYQAATSNKTVEAYLQTGGFPRAVTFPEPERLLREYFTDIIERDVRRHTTAQSLTLTQLVKLVFESAGSELSARRLAKTFGIAPETVGVYLDACERAYIILKCPFFSYSERQRVVRNKKYYPIDTGLRKAIITRGGIDKGKDLETAVFLHLRRAFREVFYWRNKGEVDFVVVEGTSVIPIQVSWEGAQQQHLNALGEWREAFPHACSALFIDRSNVEEFFRGPREWVLQGKVCHEN
jgi:uncharacterized protein